MKKVISFAVMTMVAFIATTMTSCSDDDLDEYSTSTAKATTVDQTFSEAPNYTLEAPMFATGPTHDLGLDLSVNEYHQLGMGSDAGGSVFTDLLAWAAQNIASGAASAIGSKSMGCLIDQFFQSAESKKMDQIIEMTSQLNSRFDEMIRLIKMENYEAYMNQRNEHVSALNNYSSEYAQMLAECDTTDTAQIKRIVTQWATYSPIEGNAPEVQFLNYIDFLLNTTIEMSNVYKGYDAYVYNAVPWESMGYDFRESLRASDLSIIASNAFLTIAYTKCRTDRTDAQKQRIIDNINERVQAYKAFCEDNLVEYHDAAICQIVGVHIVLDKKLYDRDYQNMVWFDKTDFWHDNPSLYKLIYGHPTYSVEHFEAMQLTVEEMERICDYYKGSKYSGMLEMFKGDAGCHASIGDVKAKDAILLVNGQCARMSDYGFLYFIFAPAVQFNTFNYGIEMIGRATISCAGWGQQEYFKCWYNEGLDIQTWICTNIYYRY